MKLASFAEFVRADCGEEPLLFRNLLGDEEPAPASGLLDENRESIYSVRSMLGLRHPHLFVFYDAPAAPTPDWS